MPQSAQQVSINATPGKPQNSKREIPQKNKQTFPAICLIKCAE